MYCYACGQKDIGERITGHVLAADAFEALTEMDSKIWRTLRELTFNPGKVAQNYIAGARACYLNPIKYFIWIFAAYFAVLVVSGALEQDIAKSIRGAENLTEEEAKSQFELGVIALRGVVREYSNVIALLTTPLFAFFLRWQLWRSRRNFVETLAYVCYLNGHAHLFMLIALLLEWSMGTFYEDLRDLIMLLFLYMGHRVFYNLGWLKAVFVTIGSVILYAIAAFFVTSGFIALRMIDII